MKHYSAEFNEKWRGDITYVQVGGAWLFLACVLDIGSRRGARLVDGYTCAH
jgi:hypothetical protein